MEMSFSFSFFFFLVKVIYLEDTSCLLHGSLTYRHGKTGKRQTEEITLFLLMATFLLENKDETIKTPSAKPLLSLSHKCMP